VVIVITTKPKHTHRHTHTHTHPYTIHQLPRERRGRRVCDRQSNGKNRKSTSLDNITEHRDTESGRKRAKRRQKTNMARTAQQNGNSHDFMSVSVSVCAYVAYVCFCGLLVE